MSATIEAFGSRQPELRSAIGTIVGRPLGSAELRQARGNLLLDGLADFDDAALDPFLKRERLRVGQVLEEDGAPATWVVFPQTAVVSLEMEANGRRIQAALVGRDGSVGGAALLGARVGNRAIVQFEGDAWCAPVDAISRQLIVNPGLRDCLQASVNGLAAQLSRTLLATGHATIEQRVARFLLMVADRIDATDIPITHSVLAETLGVRRAGVTVALHMLESRQSVRSERKRVRILDRAALTAAAGGFYQGE
jgi:CRP-like cAMP-binding protein